jgi:arabinofuranan 3-O-arabinosyltransferase
MRGRAFGLRVLIARLRTSTDSVTGYRQLLPVGIGELSLLGAHLPRNRPAETISLGCSAGLHLTVDGTSVPLRAEGLRADVLVGRPIPAVPCTGPSTLTAGSHRLALVADNLTAPESLVLRRTGTPDPLSIGGSRPAGEVNVRTWGRTDRTIQVATGRAAFLVVRENANGGWRATLHGKALPAVTLDGWEQGWLLPAGASGVVHLEFAPQPAVDWGLIVGMLVALLLIVGAVAPLRRGAAQPALVDARITGAWVVGVGLAGLLFLGGLPGIVVAGVVAGLRPMLWGRIGAWWPPAGAAGAVLAAGLLEAIRPVGSAHPLAGSAGLQLLALLALALTLLAGADGGPPRSREAAQERPLQQVPREGGDQGRGDRRQQVQREEVAAEYAPAHPVGNRDQQR